ncbi:uncharacterized protein si:dkey-30j10.5 [Electrophorus electricus]|uniref:uncharacterized protein si:dkey-30j10.5 n=1 Tax=Electrophorus electricus TaxID=8005 RepID=UPI0015D07F0A|nr:uncharacterized protein si:dkey-30j10.5 [Electrophorus electricus]
MAAVRQRITAIQISVSPEEETQLEQQGWIRVPGDLNSGTRGPQVGLWYRTDGDKRVTRIQFSFLHQIANKLHGAGFTKVDKNINENTAGDDIYLWFKCENSGNPIIDLKVTTNLEDEVKQFQSGWECLSCDLNLNNGGNPHVRMWVRRNEATYMQNVDASVNFSPVLFDKGYIHVDENTNRGTTPPGSAVFIWYNSSTSSGSGVSQLDVSLNESDEARLRKEQFIKVNKNLNDGTIGAPVYLWYKKGESRVIQFFVLLVGDEALKYYQQSGFHVVAKNLNNGNDGTPVYIAYK